MMWDSSSLLVEANVPTHVRGLKIGLHRIAIFGYANQHGTPNVESNSILNKPSLGMLSKQKQKQANTKILEISSSVSIHMRFMNDSEGSHKCSFSTQASPVIPLAHRTPLTAHCYVTIGSALPFITTLAQQ